jgi:hypothetical protein
MASNTSPKMVHYEIFSSLMLLFLFACPETPPIYVSASLWENNLHNIPVVDY